MAKRPWSGFVRHFLAAAILCLLLIATSRAQQASDAVASDPSNRQLLERISELEAKVKQLEEKQATAASAPTPAPAPEPVVETPRANTVAPRLKLNVFGDLGFRATDRRADISNSFFLGSLDLFMTSRLSDQVSLLGEILFIPQSDNGIQADVERLVVQYHASPNFNFGVGRFHTSIGYYNTAFHQGEWFQTAIGRPFMYEFDDKGGPLPLQEVGVSVNGLLPSGKLGLHYVAELGNGRAHLLGSNPAQNNQDTNNGKSVNIAIFAQPSWLPGLQTGFNVYHDYLTFSDNINHSEYISTAHVVYVNSSYEFLNEAMLVRHVNTSTGAPGVFHTPGFYTQFSRRFSSYRPYFRYEYINAGTEEPIYGDPTDGPVVRRRNGPSVGLRWDFSEHAAGKLQYDRRYIRELGAANGIATQFAFTF
jgi:hypothetical protein